MEDAEGWVAARLWVFISRTWPKCFFAMGWLLIPLQNQEESDENKMLSRGNPTSNLSLGPKSLNALP